MSAGPAQYRPLLLGSDCGLTAPGTVDDIENHQSHEPLRLYASRMTPSPVWVRPGAEQARPELADLLWRGLDRYMVTMTEAEWRARSGSPAEREAAQQAERDLHQDAQSLLYENLYGLLMGAVGHTDALAVGLQGGATIHGPGALARAVVEHAAAVVWLLAPDLSLRDRVARSIVLTAEGLEADGRALDASNDDRDRRLDRLSEIVKRSFDSTSEVSWHAVKPGEPKRLLSVAKQRVRGRSFEVAEMYAHVGGGGRQAYAWLSSLTHPMVATLLRRTTRVGDQVRSSTTVAELHLLAGVAAHALCIAVTSLARWLGVEPDPCDEWEADIAAICPAVFGEVD